jgi:hypothetical protein
MGTSLTQAAPATFDAIAEAVEPLTGRRPEPFG